MQQYFATLEQSTRDMSVQNQLLQEELCTSELLLPAHKKGHKKRGSLRSVHLLMLKTGAYGSMGAALLFLVMSSIFVCLVVGSALWEMRFPNHDSQFNLPLWRCALNALLMGAPVAAGGGVFLKAGQVAHKCAVNLDKKLTIQAAADLPLSESLLRSSSEPVQAQRDVLLRAAREAQDRHEAELVRPTQGS